jgi:uncharacterized protein YdcH (DUF465 family)
MKNFKLLTKPAIVGYVLLMAVLYSCDNGTKYQLTPIEEAHEIDKRIGGQRDLIKALYESEINQLKAENKQLKEEIVRKDSIIDKCVQLSLMVTKYCNGNNNSRRDCINPTIAPSFPPLAVI